MINPDSFCVAPWSEIRINPDGGMNFCHAADSMFISHQDNIAKITVDQYFSDADAVISTRRDLKQGHLIDRCHRCYKNEKTGSISFRQRRNLQAAIFPGNDFLPSVSEAWPRLAEWHQPRFYHISLSNLCNMACMMCSPQWSSLLTQTQHRAGVLEINTPVLRDWTQNDKIWNDFVQHLLGNKEIVCLHFMGGEPMYHKRFWQLLDLLIANDHCDFSLTFVTNGSIYNPDMIAKLKKFRSVAIEISIESLDSSNDYVRYPSHYRNIQENIKQYLDQRSQDLDVVLRSVPQLLSAANYDRLLEFARQNRVIIDSNVLHSPSFLALNVLPEQIRQDVIQRLSRFVQHKDTSIKDLNIRDSTDLDRCISVHAQMVIDLINIPCPDREAQWSELVQYCRKMDKVRKMDVTQMIPDLADYFIQSGYRD
jgi:sulfatase maturation enzyme AslB (radical SAM superfamily)